MTTKFIALEVVGSNSVSKLFVFLTKWQMKIMYISHTKIMNSLEKTVSFLNALILIAHIKMHTVQKNKMPKENHVVAFCF